MPATTAELVDLLRLEPAPDKVFVGRHPRTRMQRTYGGQVLAQALMAAYATVPDKRIAHSLDAYFIRPGDAHNDIEYMVETVRDGHTFSARRVTAVQDGRAIFTMSSSFHELEDGFDHSDPEPHGVPAPEDCPTIGEVSEERSGTGAMWHEWDALEVRFAGDSTEGGLIAPANHRGHLRVWVRTTGPLPDEIAVHQAILAYLSDLTLLPVAVIPHNVDFVSRNLQFASIDHVMWFHRRPRADQWLLYDLLSPSASHSLGMGTGRLFQNQKLIASCAQEGLIRVVDDRMPFS
ncbi:acyl-CoA thioesterase [Propionibacterium sp.]|uniref:acyl-CoA thioesterase n=1 Tax=Propionibacterium sp. TaxID=1977903 RepID=UPI0039E74A8F